MKNETQRQLARLRTALEGLGEETLFTRTREADLHFYRALGALAVLEQDAGGELQILSTELLEQLNGLAGSPPLVPMGSKS